MKPLRGTIAVKPNPYAPPRVESLVERPTWSDSTFEGEPIAFSGTVGREDLRQFLRAESDVDLAHLAAIGFAVAVILAALAILGGWFAVASLGGTGLTLIVLTVSTTPYRKLVFENLNPHWNSPVRGELRSDGIHLHRESASAFYRWDWYGRGVVGDQVVAFLPATQMAQPLLLTRSMLVGLEDWDRVVTIAKSIGGGTEDPAANELRLRDQNLRILRQPRRERTVDVPDGAIALQGRLTVADFSRIPRRHRRRERPLRTNMVIAGLLVFGGMLLAAISELIFGSIALLPGLALAYAASGYLFGRIRRLKPDGNSVYYMNAFATESKFVSDFAITTTTVAREALRLTMRTDDLIVLRRREWVQFIIARRDMFASDQDWERFTAWTSQIPEAR